MSFEEKSTLKEKLEKLLYLVEEAFQEKDFITALDKIGLIIKEDPVNKKVLNLLESITSNSDFYNSFSLYLKHNKVNGIAQLSVLTYINGLTKDFDQAILNLTELLLSTEETLYLYWLEGWIANEDFFKRLTLDNLKKALVKLMSLPNQAEFNHNIREIYEVFLGVLLKAEKFYNFEESLNYIMSVIARRCLQYQRSILIAAKSYAIKPSYFNTLALSYAYRELKDYNNTVKFFQEAINFKPDVIEVKLDLADYLCGKKDSFPKNYEKGIQLYKDVIDIEPYHAWAYPSYLYHKYLLESDLKLLNDLSIYCTANPENKRAQNLLQKLKQGKN